MSEVKCPACQYELNQASGPLLNYCPGCYFPLKTVEGKYRLVEKRGEGGFASVYKGICVHSMQIRAVKILSRKVLRRYESTNWTQERKDRKTQVFKERFRQEIRLTADLAKLCPYVVDVYDMGEDEQLGFYYVMEYLQGEPLSQVMAMWPSFRSFLVLPVFEQICAAMMVAHQNSIIHRDLKPENVIILQQPEEGRFVKVLDFGIAKCITEQCPDKTTAPLGTPVYMSPEQCYNREVDQRSDIYALGGILYHMVTGTAPFGHLQNNVELFLAHMKEEPLAPSQRDSDASIPRALDQVILKALAKAPKDRYQTVKEFWEAARPALFAWLASMPTHFAAPGASIFATQLNVTLGTKPFREDDLGASAAQAPVIPGTNAKIVWEEAHADEPGNFPQTPPDQSLELSAAAASPEFDATLKEPLSMEKLASSIPELADVFLDRSKQAGAKTQMEVQEGEWSAIDLELFQNQVSPVQTTESVGSLDPVSISSLVQTGDLSLEGNQKSQDKDSEEEDTNHRATAAYSPFVP